MHDNRRRRYSLRDTKTKYRGRAMAKLMRFRAVSSGSQAKVKPKTHKRVQVRGGAGADVLGSPYFTPARLNKGFGAL